MKRGRRVPHNWLIAALFCLASCAGFSCAEARTANVHVFIVAIGKFDDVAAYPELSAAGKQATQIVQFFRDSYGLRSNQIHVYSEETGRTSELALQNMQSDLKNAAGPDQSVVFLFILSHGKVVDSVENGKDLMIVASDTPGSADSPQPGRILGSGIFKKFLALGEQSIIFAFFDTCSSGALSNVGERFRQSFMIRHQRVISVASSGANQNSYNFAFTNALISNWKQSTNGCDLVNVMPQRIKLPEQQLRVLSSDDEICVNAIGRSNAFLFVLPEYAGPARFSVFTPPQLKPVNSRDVQDSDVLPMLTVLPRREVQIELYDTLGRELKWKFPTINLKESPLTFQELKTLPYEQSNSDSGIAYGMQSPIPQS